ncbi:tyrosine-type recombinase/integrase [Syntrophus buswellii]|uniref:tyrosine-type recombinase/integrase n=1 Tax=Syntrophus buswellii TaxID=43774 RepID=UPI0038D4A9B9
MGQYSRKLKRGVRWFYSGQYLGQKYFSRAIYLTKQEAKRAEREKIEELDELARNPISGITLIELMEARLDYLEAKKSKMYYRDNKRYFKIALDYWGRDRAADSITKKDVHDLLLAEAKRLKESKRQNYAVNALLRSLKALFNYGIKIYDLKQNPFLMAELHSIDVKLKRIPSEAEISAVREKMTDSQKFLFDFVDQTACRVSESLRFRAEDIDGELITLWTRKAKNSNLTPRRIPKPECLTRYRGRGKVFEWTDHPGFLEKYIKEAGQKPWNWHCLRHRRASIWANDGMTIIEIMNRLGHSNLSTCQRYLRLLGFTKY